MCKGVEIDITGVNNHFFIDKNDVHDIIRKVAGGKVEQTPVSKLNLSEIETEIKKNIWIRDAESFIDNNGMLVVEIDEREPVARVFTTAGSTFYIDSSLMMLPLSEKFSARVPVFTNFPTEAKVLPRRDSSLLRDISLLSQYIHDDEFLMGMIDQVDINNYSFEFIPKVGNQVIVFGDGNDIDDKFSRMKLFYKQVMAKAGWNYYSVVNLSYNNQVVAKRRDAGDIVADSLRTMQLLKVIAERAKQMAEDSVLQAKAEKEFADSTMILQSVQRDEEPGGEQIELPREVVTEPVLPSPVAPKTSPVTPMEKKPVSQVRKEQEKKPVTVNKDKPKTINKTVTKQKPVPKATMPPKTEQPANDY